MAQTIGQRFGGYAEELERLLQTLGGYEQPRYRSRRQETDGIQVGVVTQLRLRSVQQHHPRRDNINLTVRRCSFEMGVQDLARRALLRLSATHLDLLRGTEYRYLVDACIPVPVPDTAPHHQEMGEAEGGAMRALGRLARAQCRVAESVAEELTEVYHRLEDAQRHIVELEERLHGGAPPPVPEPIPAGNVSRGSAQEEETQADQPASLASPRPPYFVPLLKGTADGSTIDAC
ncbi:uncharacterized protein LOC119298189 [Triticum dicoccoides]|uniref:uncharacterized protein LOC119298189 n=1 Tax=Triticum dicoccoides TaxID=85692 RepID=UPI00188FDCD8|nr:uncharacterized protein LOC119298189 [Triticum dicoccoides]